MQKSSHFHHLNVPATGAVVLGLIVVVWFPATAVALVGDAAADAEAFPEAAGAAAAPGTEVLPAAAAAGAAVLLAMAGGVAGGGDAVAFEAAGGAGAGILPLAAGAAGALAFAGERRDL